ncbi:MAG: hypothetical protein MSC31_10885 [Solirubrobacteraceae bacterium MAG38_C4-C5]|nr:hypothetical protein [Candidatus Siliceabacter maunaloa]
MTALRIAHRRATEPVSAPCGRCLLTVEAPAGAWIAVEADGTAPVCDPCARRDDPQGHGQLTGWRRAAAGAARRAAA